MFYLLQIEGNNLFYIKLILCAHTSDFECEFVVFQCDYLVRCKSLLKLKLLCASAVETQEAGGEENCILEVSFHLLLYRVANKTFKLLVCNTDTTIEFG